MASELTAASFTRALMALANPNDAAELQRYFKTGPGEYGEGDLFLGVRVGPIRQVARAHVGMPVAELETMLDNDWHEVREGALLAMDLEATKARTPEARLTELFDLYLRRTDRINNWDLVDCSCRSVVGGYLLDKPRGILHTLAESANLWERRIAIVSCWSFIRVGDMDDAITISELLLGDREDLIHKATGWMLREVGDRDRARLLNFLDQHAATMPRTALRYAIEKFTPADRSHYLGMKSAG